MRNKLCHRLSTIKRFPHEQAFEKLYQFASVHFEPNFSLEWFCHVLEKMDEIYYENQLLPQVAQHYGGMNVSVKVDDEQVAGYVYNTKKSVSFCINRDLFRELFTGGDQSYHAGGLVCKDRLVCLLHVILHESVHLALLICRPKDVRHHGQHFNRLTKILFGHVDSQHGLIKGLNPQYDLQTIQQRLHRGQLVKIYINHTWIPAKIVKVNRKQVYLSNDDQNFTVHAGLVNTG